MVTQNRNYYMANCIERILISVIGTENLRNACEKIANAVQEAARNGEQAGHVSLIHALHYFEGKTKKRSELKAS